MTLTIEGGPGSGWTVTKEDRSCPNLAWDEMIGLVARLTLELPPQYSMKTKEERECSVSESLRGKQNPPLIAPSGIRLAWDEMGASTCSRCCSIKPLGELVTVEGKLVCHFCFYP